MSLNMYIESCDNHVIYCASLPLLTEDTTQSSSVSTREAVSSEDLPVVRGVEKWRGVVYSVVL